MSLQDALNASPVILHTIENEQIELSVDEVISPQTVKILHGKGMPIEDVVDPLAPVRLNHRKGNLIVRFDIQFPEQLSETQKEDFAAVLDEI